MGPLEVDGAGSGLLVADGVSEMATFSRADVIDLSALSSNSSTCGVSFSSEESSSDSSCWVGSVSEASDPLKCTVRWLRYFQAF